MIIINRTIPNRPMPSAGVRLEPTGEVWRVHPVSDEYLRTHPSSQKLTAAIAGAIADRFGLTLELLD